MKYFYRTLIFDFGSSSTVVCDESGRILFDEATEIAYFVDGCIEIGQRSRIFCEGESKLIKPIVCGYVNNSDAFEDYVKRLVKKLVFFPRLCLKTVVIAIPNDLAGDENSSAGDRAFFEPFRKIGIKDIRVIHRSVAAHLGASTKKVTTPKDPSIKPERTVHTE